MSVEPGHWARRSFDEVYDEHFAFTWRSLRYLGVPPAGMDDAAQEVWLVVHRRLREFQGNDNFRTWLFRVAVNVTRNLKRGQRRRGLSEPLPDKLASTLPDPLIAREGNELWTRVERFLSQMDEQRRAVFVGCLLEGLSPAECAAATGLDTTTVQHRVRALRRSVQRWLLDQREAAQ